MDKEKKQGRVLYHLSPEEVNYLRGNGFGYIALYYIPRSDGGRTIGTERSTPLGRRNQRYLEKVMKEAGFSVNLI